MIDRATLDQLILRGRERGELTVEEFQAALPVDSMDVDALVLVMLELEAAGVAVEPDAFGPRADRPLPRPPELPPASADAPPSVAGAAAGGPMADEPGPAKAEAPAVAGTSGDRVGVGRIVLLSGLAAFLILAIVLVLI